MKLLLVFFIFYKVMRNLGSSCEENIDCLVSEDGASYNGTLSTTESGYPCTPWIGMYWIGLDWIGFHTIIVETHMNETPKSGATAPTQAKVGSTAM